MPSNPRIAQLERELKSAQERIRSLEEALTGIATVYWRCYPPDVMPESLEKALEVLTAPVS